MEEEKKKRTVHRRTKEQREFLPWIREHMIPAVKENLAFFESFCRQYQPKQNVSQALWAELQNKALAICDFGKEQEFFNFYKVERLEKARWQENHSTIYYIRADDDIKFSLGFIERAYKCNLEDPNEQDMYDFYMHQLFMHIYSYLCTQEK